MIQFNLRLLLMLEKRHEYYSTCISTAFWRVGTASSSAIRVVVVERGQRVWLKGHFTWLSFRTRWPLVVSLLSFSLSLSLHSHIASVSLPIDMFVLRERAHRNICVGVRYKRWWEWPVTHRLHISGDIYFYSPPIIYTYVSSSVSCSFLTAPDGLSPPTLANATSSSLSVSWTGPLHPNAPGLLYYSLQMRTSPQQPVMRWEWQQVLQQTHVLLRLHMHTHVHAKETIIQHIWIRHINMTDHQKNTETQTEWKDKKKSKTGQKERQNVMCAPDMYSLHASWQQIAI